MLIYAKHIRREDLQANPRCMYLFGDNHLRTGSAGQAGAMRGEPNAHGIRTKWMPHNGLKAFFNDADYDVIVPLIDEDFQAPLAFARSGGIVVCPLDGLGTGFARLQGHAPKVLRYLREKVKEVQEAHKLPGPPRTDQPTPVPMGSDLRDAGA